MSEISVTDARYVSLSTQRRDGREVRTPVWIAGVGSTQYVFTEARAVPGQQAQAAARNLVGRTVAEVEQDLILETLRHCLGNRTHAAHILGISIRTLRNKLKQYSDEGVRILPPPTGQAA